MPCQSCPSCAVPYRPVPCRACCSPGAVQAGRAAAGEGTGLRPRGRWGLQALAATIRLQALWPELSPGHSPTAELLRRVLRPLRSRVQPQAAGAVQHLLLQVFLSGTGMGWSQENAAMCPRGPAVPLWLPSAPHQVPSPGPLAGSAESPRQEGTAGSGSRCRSPWLPAVRLWAQPRRGFWCSLCSADLSLFICLFIRGFTQGQGWQDSSGGTLLGWGELCLPPAMPFPGLSPSSCPLQHQDLSHSLHFHRSSAGGVAAGVSALPGSSGRAGHSATTDGPGSLSLELGLARWCPVGWRAQGWRWREPWGGWGSRGASAGSVTAAPSAPVQRAAAVGGWDCLPPAKGRTELSAWGLSVGTVDNLGGCRAVACQWGSPHASWLL